MVAKDGLLGTLSASELEFIAGNESIEIQPRANLGTLHLISVPMARNATRSPWEQDDYGPLRPNTNVAVPLWLALQLRKAQYCRVIAPQWMSVGHLQDLLTREISNKDDFQQIPFHYVEISTMLFEWYQWGSLSKRTESAAEDVPQAEQVRILIQNIREQRHAKIQAGLPMIDGNPLKVPIPYDGRR